MQAYRFSDVTPFTLATHIPHRHGKIMSFKDTGK
jgi:hypothetical protein